MWYKHTPWACTAALLAATSILANAAAASSSFPSINVALKTSFSSSPYLLELLETAADEDESSYVPLLNHIARGAFQDTKTDEQLYKKFIQLIEDESLFKGALVLSSYKLALSLHSAAPRIEAHYQYYRTVVEPRLKNEDQTSCPNWVLLGNKQYCSAELDRSHGDFVNDFPLETLAFDRVIGNLSAPVSILYADITSPTFSAFHDTLIKTAREQKTSYRVRHRPSLARITEPLVISGYGVELALKRTDYIVIDDREQTSETDENAKAVTLEDKDVGADLKPLSKTELLRLGLRASSFVMESEKPFEALVKLSQDFPKFSSAMAAYEISESLKQELAHNRELLQQPGLNGFWMNGQQLIERQVDAFTMLDLIRKERKLIARIQALGLTGLEAIKLISHNKVATSKGLEGPARYLWSDKPEGGDVILWLNNIEQDERYQNWPSALNALLQRTYPGQLPVCRRDIHNLVFPLDLTSVENLSLIVGQLRGFVERVLPLRFGIVPITNTKAAIDQAKIVYYLQHTYGLAAVLQYLGETLKAGEPSEVSTTIFDSITTDHSPKELTDASTMEQVLASEVYTKRISDSQRWVTRLSADPATPILFANGAVVPRTEDWLQTMSGIVFPDLQLLQQTVFEEAIDSKSWIPDFFLQGASERRNPLIIPEDDSSLKLFNMHDLQHDHKELFSTLPTIEGSKSTEKTHWAQITLITDLDTDKGKELLDAAKGFSAQSGVELLTVSNKLSPDSVAVLKGADSSLAIIRDYLTDVGVNPGEHYIMINGRLVGPILNDALFTADDFEHLTTYERTRRVKPVLEAIEDLGLLDRVDNHLDVAKFASVIAIAKHASAPLAIYEQASGEREDILDMWASEHTAIEIGDVSTAVIQLVATIDPASEVAQRWVPILKVLSELQGVYLKLYLNPVDRLKELPVKRFYRYVLSSEPTFNQDGSLQSLSANFAGVPQEALLTVGMQVSPAWLVAPKETVHDLDNIKLSNVKGDVDAIYELEHILIEGHTREVSVSSGSPPRGAQLVLGTDRDAHIDDTIIMANLGYFQFKANPGYYHISLQEGRSAEIFSIESLGAQGWQAVEGDESSDIALISFQGATLFPRLTRNVGMEQEDVLEAKLDSKLSTSFKSAQKMLGLGKKSSSGNKHADINIFSVASGHLYERMLNIMMVSVMKHTKHTVKFWFIEQFLSPSFRDFIPHLAAEYGFEYEMVTYKWPHWLRAQTEKQREIWGYKILFLDVLFPLSLDKVIFVDADQIVRTDMMELVNHDLKGAPYGFTPMCDSRVEMEGFRFWKQGYWKNFLRGLPYHISALYVVDLKAFRQMAAGDRLRQQYHQLSADPGSLSNLDQDLPNHMQSQLRIHSLPQEWLWCETWCSDESLGVAKTIDLCNNPQTKEPKLDRARRQVPEWTIYDDEIAAVDKRRRGTQPGGEPVVGQKNPKSRSLMNEKDEL